MTEYTKYIGQIQLLENNLGTNIHNQYCYKIKNDNENFILLSAAYNSGTHIHILNYQLIRDNLLNISSSITDNNLQVAIIDHIRLKEDYESENQSSGFNGVWSTSICPNSRIIFDSCIYGPTSTPRGFRVFKVNSMPEVENDRQVPSFYSQVTTYNKKMIISRDPLTPIHPGFFRLILRNSNVDYTYAVLVTDPDDNTSFKGLIYGDCQLDLGHFNNMLSDNAEDISYTIIIYYNN